MNDIMKRLTIVSTIFIPLTFLVGVWGMNYKWMPELEWQYGYLFAWIVMAIIGIIVYLYFRKRNGINKNTSLVMKSIKELYRIGTGPSSSHTMGPRKAAEMFLERHPDAASFKVTLYGSLAATGKGHMTDVAIIDTLQPTAPVEIVWQPKVFLPFHPNGMTFAALDSNDKVQENWTVYSIGGGALAENNDNPTIESPDVYGMENMTEILQWCEDTGKVIGNT